MEACTRMINLLTNRLKVLENTTAFLVKETFNNVQALKTI